MKQLALMLLAACSYSSPADPSDGAISDDGTTIGDGPSDVPIVDDDDDDNDGVLDVDDNCPLKSNADQHDEDVDTRGDVCDPCPMFADGDGDDDDGDGIGDACDPHPNTGGDVLVLFDGFGVDGGLPAAWTPIGGVASDWEVNSDELRIDTQTASHELRTDAGGPHVTVHFVFTHSNPGGGVPAAAAVLDGDATLDNELACTILTQTTNNNMLAVQCVNGSCSPFGGNGDGAANNPVRIIATTESNQLVCGFERNGAGGSFGSPGVTPSRNGAGIGVQSLRLAIPFVAVYRAP